MFCFTAANKIHVYDRVKSLLQNNQFCLISSLCFGYEYGIIGNKVQGLFLHRLRGSFKWEFFSENNTKLREVGYESFGSSYYLFNQYLVCYRSGVTKER